MKHTTRWIGTAAAVTTLAVLAACATETDGSPGATGETVKIGVVVDQTGPTASLGIQSLNGVQLAVDLANEAGGIDDRSIELVIQDGTSDPAVAAAAARSLSTRSDVVIGANTGAACRAMQPILDSAGVLQWCLSPQTFDITPLYFWNQAPITDYIPATTPWLHDLGVERVGFIGQNDASGDGYLSLFQYISKQNPEIEIVVEERFNSGATNLETQMTRLRDADVDLIVTGTSGGNIVPIVQAANALGMEQPIWVGTGSASPEALQPLAGDLPDGGMFINAFWVDLPEELPSDLAYGDQIETFVAAYVDAYGSQPSNGAAGAYDATRLIIEALRSGATGGEALAEYIESASFTGVLGDYAFAADRHQGASMVPTMMRYVGADGFRLAFDGS